MLRAIWLTVTNEARLLTKDPIVLFMLLFAPVVIIAVAGYSLGSLYGGGANTFRVPVVDFDHGVVAQDIIAGLRNEPSITVELVDNREQARQWVGYRDRTPLAIEIPAGTSDAEEHGGQAQLVLYVDPVRRVEANVLELRIAERCRAVAEQAHAQVQRQLDVAASNLREQVGQLSATVERQRSQARDQWQRAEAELQSVLRTQITTALRNARDEAETLGRARETRAWNQVQQELSARQSILRDIQSYLEAVQSSQHALERWLEQLRALAGRHAEDIPPPPAFPAPPSPAQLTALVRPLSPPTFAEDGRDGRKLLDTIAIRIPTIALPADGDIRSDLQRFASVPAVALPGTLGFVETPAIDGEDVVINAFDQYVPGFGVTFLMIGMMLGIALTLFDERDWGTLNRLRVSGAPLTGLLIGKLVARFAVGTVQMLILFGVGRLLFGISLGRQPVALLIPTVAISFASAALGFVITSIARAHDSVMPLGTVVSMAMAAIGGCWWPLDFEPGWMRAVAQWLPTTWTMEAFNNLMIRSLPASSTLWPFAATVGLGVIFLATGIHRLVNSEQ